MVVGGQIIVEGELDSIILNRLLSSAKLPFTVLITKGGSKYGLKLAVKTARQVQELKIGITKQEPRIYFIRDRDFDFDVDMSISTPQEIKEDGKLLGWHWCRHEIENYLLEPAILSAVFDKPINAIEVALSNAASSIATYEAARSTIGKSKRQGMPAHLETRPKIFKNKEIKVPNDWGRSECLGWVETSTAEFINTAQEHLNKTIIKMRFEENEKIYNSTQCNNVQWVLHTFSGKDLFAAMTPWFKAECNIESGKRARDIIKVWIDENADTAIQVITEWQSAVEQFEKVFSDRNT